MAFSLKFLAVRYPRGIEPLSSSSLLVDSLSSGKDIPLVGVVKIRSMKKESLKATTIRFTESDLEIVESLQQKLGLGMIHVIRLAIRRLAETENLLFIAARHKKT